MYPPPAKLGAAKDGNIVKIPIIVVNDAAIPKSRYNPFLNLRDCALKTIKQNK